jgi:prepilin-type N-terminal cleavage/methylation domain-containing protein
MQTTQNGQHGFTVVELIVALLLFAVGGLALASTSALIGRSLNVDVVRERAARVATRQIELAAASCHDAVGGRSSSRQIDSEWLVSRPSIGRVEVIEAVAYSTATRLRSDSYHALLHCP